MQSREPKKLNTCFSVPFIYTKSSAKRHNECIKNLWSILDIMDIYGYSKKEYNENIENIDIFHFKQMR